MWIIFGALSIVVGLYPALYFFIDKRFAILGTKPANLLDDTIYNAFFYTHITLGGLALLIGWTQFITALKNKRLSLHRTIGKVYISAALLSAIAGLYIAVFATGGVITAMGFSALGIIWFSTTLLAYRAIRHRHIAVHQRMMIYSYAACFAAVTLRLWLPLLTSLSGDFFFSYKIVSWLCWVPNMIVAYFITRRLDKKEIVLPVSTRITTVEKRIAGVGD